MSELNKKPSYNSKAFFLIAFFMFYLIYMDGTISGNSVILTICGCISFIIGLWYIDGFRLRILKGMGISEVDVEKNKDSNKEKRKGSRLDSAFDVLFINNGLRQRRSTAHL